MPTLKSTMAAVVFVVGSGPFAPLCLAQEFSYQHAAKFLCGKGDGLATVAGMYLTAINIHNPQYAAVPFRWKVAVAFPKLVQGPISPFSPSRLGDDGAAEVTCKDILRQLGPLAPPSPFLSGFVVFESAAELDVVGVYTILDQSGRSIGIDLQQYTARAQRPAGRPDLAIPSSCTIVENRTVTATVRNIGAGIAAPSTTRFSFSGGAHIDVPTPSLNAGASATVSAQIPAASCFQPDCHIRVTSDALSVVSETNETNNENTCFAIG